jgi:hypothetical protein
MVGAYPLSAPTIARKEAARMAREANEKRKTRQVAATRVQLTAEAEVDPLPDKPFRQPKIVTSVDVTPLRGSRSGACTSLDSPYAKEHHPHRFSGQVLCDVSSIIT